MKGCESRSKKPKWTRLIIIDFQAAKNTCNVGVESKGFCFYKATNGIKRHLAVDTLGFSFFIHCTPANVSDDEKLLEILKRYMNYFQAKPAELRPITILLDHGYNPDYFTQALQKVDPQIMIHIDFERSLKPFHLEKAGQGKPGFEPVTTR